MNTNVFTIIFLIINVVITISVSLIISDRNKKFIISKCKNNNDKEQFKPYNNDYNNGMDINTVICSDIKCTKSFTMSAPMTFHNTSNTDSEPTDTNRTIEINKEGKINFYNKSADSKSVATLQMDNTGKVSGVSTLSSTDISNSNKITSKDIANSNALSTKTLSCSESLTTKDLSASNSVKLPDKDKILVNNVKLFNLIYPIGAIYISISAKSPATLFGGKWEQIYDRFLYTAKTDIGKLGGASTVKLSVSNIPSHSHSSPIASGRDGNPDAWHDTCGANTQQCSYWYGNKYLSHNISTGSTGSGQAFSIMPPYYRVYCWRRTALA